MFLSRRGRVFYMMISHQPIPGHLEHLVDSILAPSRLELFLRRGWQLLEPYSPVLIVLIAILLVVAGWTNLSLR